MKNLISNRPFVVMLLIFIVTTLYFLILLNPRPEEPLEPCGGPYFGKDISCECMANMTSYFNQNASSNGIVKPEDMDYFEVDINDLRDIVNTASGNEVYLLNLAYFKDAAVDYSRSNPNQSPSSIINKNSIAFAYIDNTGAQHFANIGKICPPPTTCAMNGFRFKINPHRNAVCE